MFGNSAASWKTYPKRRFSGGTRVRSAAEKTVVPSTVMTPSSGRASPAMQLRRVVLPWPEGPKMEVTGAWKVTAHSRVKAAYRLTTSIVAIGSVMRATRHLCGWF